MKTRFLIALAGLAVSSDLRSFAQQKDTTVDPQITQKIRAIDKAYTEAINHNDAAAIAALYTEDEIFCERQGQSTVGKPFTTMRLRVLLVLTALAFGFAVPALAFEGDLAGDVKALDEFAALGMKYDEAYKKSDATALAALFTEDAVLGNTGRAVFRSAGRREMVCRLVRAMASHQQYRPSRSAECDR
jgi:ketosteroid isomerase-like protein